MQITCKFQPFNDPPTFLSPSHNRPQEFNDRFVASFSRQNSPIFDENVENVLLRMITRVQLENVRSTPDCKRATIPC